MPEKPREKLPTSHSPWEVKGDSDSLGSNSGQGQNEAPEAPTTPTTPTTPFVREGAPSPEPRPKRRP